jgi:hypothetical protein
VKTPFQLKQAALQSRGAIESAMEKKVDGNNYGRKEEVLFYHICNEAFVKPDGLVSPESIDVMILGLGMSNLTGKISFGNGEVSVLPYAEFVGKYDVKQLTLEQLSMMICLLDYIIEERFEGKRRYENSGKQEDAGHRNIRNAFILLLKIAKAELAAIGDRPPDENERVAEYQALKRETRTSRLLFMKKAECKDELEDVLKNPKVVPGSPLHEYFSAQLLDIESLGIDDIEQHEDNVLDMVEDDMYSKPKGKKPICVIEPSPPVVATPPKAVTPPPAVAGAIMQIGSLYLLESAIQNDHDGVLLDAVNEGSRKQLHAMTGVVPDDVADLDVHPVLSGANFNQLLIDEAHENTNMHIVEKFEGIDDIEEMSAQEARNFHRNTHPAEKLTFCGKRNFE